MRDFQRIRQPPANPFIFRVRAVVPLPVLIVLVQFHTHPVYYCRNLLSLPRRATIISVPLLNHSGYCKYLHIYRYNVVPSQNNLRATRLSYLSKNFIWCREREPPPTHRDRDRDRPEVFLMLKNCCKGTDYISNMQTFLQKNFNFL